MQKGKSVACLNLQREAHCFWMKSAKCLLICKPNFCVSWKRVLFFAWEVVKRSRSTYVCWPLRIETWSRQSSTAHFALICTFVWLCSQSRSLHYANDRETSSYSPHALS